MKVEAEATNTGIREYWATQLKDAFIACIRERRKVKPWKPPRKETGHWQNICSEHV